MTEFEKHADLALRLMYKDEEFDAQLSMGNADDCLRDNPKQLTQISDLRIVGNFYASMVFYGWRKTHVVNMAYWGLSKSLLNYPKDLNSITARILVMMTGREQLKSTVATIFGSNRSPYNPFDKIDFMFGDDEILDKIEISEMLSVEGSFTENTINERWGVLYDKYQNELSANPQFLLLKAKEYQTKMFEFLNDKILLKLDLDFD